ncbi:MAG TPA: hypothetical protein VF332_00360 [Vicinamibacterales bacterium]
MLSMILVGRLDDHRLAEEPLQGSRLPRGGPPLEFGRAVCSEHEAVPVACRLHLHLIHQLTVAAVEALRHAQ